MKEMTDKQKHWSNIIKQWSASGLTQVEYCQQNDINLKSFYTWKWQLDNRDKPKTKPKQPKFLPLTLDNKVADNNNITITVNGTDIHYRNDTNGTLLLQLIKLLKVAA